MQMHLHLLIILQSVQGDRSTHESRHARAHPPGEGQRISHSSSPRLSPPGGKPLGDRADFLSPLSISQR